MRTATAAELATHPFLAGMRSDHLGGLVELAEHDWFPMGQRIFEEGTVADRFWLLWDGRVSLDLHVPGRGDLVVESIGGGSILGWSWMFSPHRWRFGAVATADTRATVFDGPLVRSACFLDPVFGVALYERFAEVTTERLQATRLRLLDLYAGPADREI